MSDKTLVGTAPEVIRHFIELRGIGIVDVRRIFGIGAIKMTEKVELVINLEPWRTASSTTAWVWTTRPPAFWTSQCPA